MAALRFTSGTTVAPRTFSWPAAVALLLALSSLRLASASFAADYLKAFKCPAVTSFDTVDISAYTGRWYEIGLTARFRFKGELGLTCTTATYTANGQINGRNQIKVLNRGKYNIAVPRRGQLFLTSLNADRIAINLKIVCRVALNAARASAQAQALLATNATYVTAANAEPLAAAASKLEAFATSMNSEATMINNALEAFQRAANKMNQRGQPKDFNAAKGRMLSAIQDVQGAAGRILKNAFTGKLAAQGLGGALSVMGGKNAVAAASGLSSLVGNTRVQFAANTIIRLATVMQAMTLAIVAAPSGSIVQGGFPRARAEQTTEHPGQLYVIFFGVKSPKPNYIITDLQGDASSGYTLATVITCGQGQTTMWLLSRTPTVAQSEIDAALERAKTAGVRLSGANPFLLTEQGSKTCSKYISKLK